MFLLTIAFQNHIQQCNTVLEVIVCIAMDIDDQYPLSTETFEYTLDMVTILLLVRYRVVIVRSRSPPPGLTDHCIEYKSYKFSPRCEMSSSAGLAQFLRSDDILVVWPDTRWQLVLW